METVDEVADEWGEGDAEETDEGEEAYDEPVLHGVSKGMQMNGQKDKVEGGYEDVRGIVVRRVAEDEGESDPVADVASV